MVNSAVKVFKKASPNGKITAYLTQRDFVDNNGKTSPVSGVLVCDEGAKVFARVAITYRYGQEDDEMMGMSFCKEFILINDQVGPGTKDANSATETQKRLIEKIGGNAHAFQVKLADNTPASVTLDGGDDGSPDMGVVYDLRFYVGSKSEDNPDKKNSVAFPVRKIQYAKADSSAKPSIHVDKGFTLSKGKLIMDVSCNKETYYHGDDVIVSVNIDNSSKKQVKLVKIYVIQNVIVTMTKNNFNRNVAFIESKEGCPITPGVKLDKKYTCEASASAQKKKAGIALDGGSKEKDSNLASSTLQMGSNADDSLGIMVSYTVKVVLDCGKIAGSLTAELPIKMVYPDPANTEGELSISDYKNLRRGKSIAED